MFKLILVVSMAVYAVSVPLDGTKNPSKDDSEKKLVSGLPLIEPEATVEHKQQKRLDVIGAGYALADKEQKEHQKDQSNENKHLIKRDTPTKKSDQSKSDQKERKTRDTPVLKDQSENKTKKDQHRVARDAHKEDKPKRDIPEPKSNPSTQQKPQKAVLVYRRDTTKNDEHIPKKNAEPLNDEHIRNNRETQVQKDKVPEKNVPKSITKREAKEDKGNEDSKPTKSKDTKKQSKQ